MGHWSKCRKPEYFTLNPNREILNRWSCVLGPLCQDLGRREQQVEGADGDGSSEPWSSRAGDINQERALALAVSTPTLRSSHQHHERKKIKPRNKKKREIIWQATNPREKGDWSKNRTPKRSFFFHQRIKEFPCSQIRKF